MNAEIKIPDGYRQLKPGEYTKPGDLWLSFPDMTWDKNTDCFCSECGHVTKTNVVPKSFDLESGWMIIRKEKKAGKK